jgi:hypothetical protein
MKQEMTHKTNSGFSRHQIISSENDAESVESSILQAVRSIRYGSVEVIIHDSCVVQIECKKKIRIQSGSATGKP